MATDDILPHLLRRQEATEDRLNRIDDRLTSAILEDLGTLDKRVQHLEDGAVRMTERIDELKDGLAKSLTVGEEIRQMLAEHITTETRDRLVIVGGLLLAILSVFGTALWNHLLAGG